MTDESNRVSEEDVQHIADLARVTLEDDEIEEYISQMDDVLDRFETLDEVDVTAEDNDQLENIVRPDVIDESLSQEEALSNAEKTKDGYFEGPSTN